MVESINKSSQGVLLQSLLTSEITHVQPSPQVTQPVSTSPVTTCLDGRCGTLSLPVVARALGSVTNTMPFIFIPSVSGSKTTVSLVRSSALTPTTTNQAKVPTAITPDVAAESLTVVPNVSMTPSHQSSMQSLETGNVSPVADARSVAMPLIRPSPAKGAYKTSFLPILPRYRTRGRPKPRTLANESQRSRSPPPTEEEVREKVMAILGRMKEIEERQRREKEEAIVARIGGIKRATRAARSTKRSESPGSREFTVDVRDCAKSQRLGPTSPASSAGETVASSQLADVARGETVLLLKPEECALRRTPPPPAPPLPPQTTKLFDRTPSPPGTDFGSGHVSSTDPFQVQSSKSLDNQSRSASSMSSSGPIVRRCTCSRTGCLKLYCDCFAAGLRCSDCCCIGCRNNTKYEELRQQAIDRIVTRKPDAFLSKIEYSSENESVHTRGCNCKRSACLKNYCECYEARIRCTSRCRCQSCFNTETWNGQSTPASCNSQSKLSPQQQQQQARSKSVSSSTTAIGGTTENSAQSTTPPLPVTGSHEELDALSAMLIDRSDSPELSRSTERYATTNAPAGFVNKRPDDDLVIALDGDNHHFAAADSPNTSRSSSPPAPSSTSSSVVPNPVVETHGSHVPNTGGATTVAAAAPSVTGIQTVPRPTSPLVHLDRVWHVLSQTATPVAQPVPNTLGGLQVPGNATAAPSALTPVATQLVPVPAAPQPPALLGFPAESTTNLLATWLVALLSGQSQTAFATQQTPNFLNPTTVTSISPSAILLNCPTTATTTMATVTTAVVSTGPVEQTAHMPTPLPTPVSPQLVSDCVKLESASLGVACPATASVDANRLNGDGEYTAEELATFERLIQQRHRPTAAAAASSTSNAENELPPIKKEPSEMASSSPTVCPTNTPKCNKFRLPPVRRLNTEVLYLRRQVLRLTRTVRSQDRSIRALQRTIRQMWMSDSTLSR